MPRAVRQFAAKSFELVREIALPRAAVWRILSHTDHLNRAIGLPAVSYGAPDENLMRQASAKMHGMPLRWKEFPFEWVREEKYSIRREYQAGPLALFDGGIELSDVENSPHVTRVRVYAALAPANALGAALLPVIARSSMDKTWKYCQHALQEGVSAPDTSTPIVLPQPTIASPADEAQLHRLVRRLESESRRPRLAQKLGEFLKTRGDDEVAHIKPYQLAAQWNEERDEVLRLCLHAVKSGLLDLSWNLMCPNCRVSKEQVATLSQVSEQVHCDLCGVNYDLDFDRYVELRFAPHPSVRVSNENIFCLAGPFMSPHVLMQKRLASNASTLLIFPGVADELRLRATGANHVVRFDKESEEVSKLIYNASGWNVERVLRPREGATLEIENRSPRDVWLALEKTEWDDEAVTAARVTAMPEFRDNFSSEVLAPGRHLAIQNLTLLFSDLRDSTQMYEREGDAPAYGCVRKHFDLLFEEIGKGNGAIVKTIGDAVMAVFPSPRQAVRAALEIQKRVPQFNASLGREQSIAVKLGLHHGAAIAVNSNDRLDYFGRVVNIAARLGDASKGDDVVLSESCYADPSVQSLLQEYSAAVEETRATLKGIEEEQTVFRARISNS